MDFRKPFGKKESGQNNESANPSKKEDLYCKFKTAEHFSESPDNIHIIDKVKYKEDSFHNACQIWKGSKNFSKAVNTVIPFTDSISGLKDIIDKKRIRGCFCNDIIIVVYSGDFNNKIAISSDPGSRYDNGQGETDKLKEFLRETFTPHNESLINPYKNDFDIKFIHEDLPHLKGKAAVILTEYNYIPNENSFIIANVSLKNGEMKYIYNDQKFFQIGKSRFSNMQIDIPSDIDFLINNTKTDQGHKFDLEHNPGEISGNKTIIRLKKQDTDNSPVYENWVIDKDINNQERTVWIYKEGEKENGHCIDIKMRHPSESQGAEKNKSNRENKSAPVSSDTREPESSIAATKIDPPPFEETIHEPDKSTGTRPGLGPQLNHFTVEESYQLVPYTGDIRDSLKFNLDKNGMVLPGTSKSESSAEIVLADNKDFILTPFNGFQINSHDDKFTLPVDFESHNLCNGNNTIKIDSQKVPFWSLHSEKGKRYWGSIEFSKNYKYTMSSEYDVLTAGTGIYSDINTGIYSGAAENIFKIVNSVNDNNLKNNIISVILANDSTNIENIIEKIVNYLESKNANEALIRSFKRYKDDYNYDLSKISSFNASRKQAFISNKLILNVGTFPVFILKDNGVSFEVIKEVPGKDILLENSSNWCSECVSTINRAFDPNAAPETRLKVFDPDFTGCSKCETKKGMAEIGKGDLICAGLKIFKFSK